MPGRRAGIERPDTNVCRRCQIERSTVTVRAEPLCKECFSKYVSTKVVKRMESFRVRNCDSGQERVLLLPLSLGTCSVVLLDILSKHLRGQMKKTGRTGFKLHVLHIQKADDAAESTGRALGRIEKLYPEHKYTLSSLSDVFSFEATGELSDFVATLAPGARPEVSEHDTLLGSLDSATSRADVANILLRKLITVFAAKQHCEAILWADSITTLAQRTLAETAKGRGASLPWIVADGESPSGVPYYHPLQDLLSSEIASFGSFLDPSVGEAIIKANHETAISTKNTTIDALMKQYFESVEQDYPSIVANVVKTAGKLRATPLSEIEQQCEICDTPLDGPDKSRLCYGCIRTLSKSAG